MKKMYIVPHFDAKSFEPRDIITRSLMQNGGSGYGELMDYSEFIFE